MSRDRTERAALGFRNILGRNFQLNFFLRFTPTPTALLLRIHTPMTCPTCALQSHILLLFPQSRNQINTHVHNPFLYCKQPFITLRAIISNLKICMPYRQCSVILDFLLYYYRFINISHVFSFHVNFTWLFSNFINIPFHFSYILLFRFNLLLLLKC